MVDSLNDAEVVQLVGTSQTRTGTADTLLIHFAS